MLVMFFCLVIVAWYVFRPLSTEALDEPLTVITVSVEKGDSLWEIAERFDNNKMDLRRYIYIIEQYNRLDTSVLQPGQQLRIPVY